MHGGPVVRRNPPPRHDPDKQKHHEVLKAADSALERFEQGKRETYERLRRALAAYEERRSA